MKDYLYQKDILLPLGWIMGGSWQKGTRNDMTKSGNVGGFQYFERKDNKGVDGRIG